MEVSEGEAGAPGRVQAGLGVNVDGRQAQKGDDRGDDPRAGNGRSQDA
jgi:hypothetical protein